MRLNHILGLLDTFTEKVEQAIQQVTKRSDLQELQLEDEWIFESQVVVFFYLSS